MVLWKKRRKKVSDTYFVFNKKKWQLKRNIIFCREPESRDWSHSESTTLSWIFSIFFFFVQQKSRYCFVALLYTVPCVPILVFIVSRLFDLYKYRRLLYKRTRSTNQQTKKKINSRKLSTYYICLWILHMCERMSCMWFAITNLAVCLKNKRLFSCGSATWTWTKHSPCGSTLKYRVDDK